MAQHEAYSLGINTNFDSVLKANKAINVMYESLKKVDSRFSGMHVPSGLPREVNHMSAVTTSYVQRLESEGKTYKANQARVAAYSETLGRLNNKQRALESQLGKIADKSGTTSKAYKEQQVRINATATSINNLQKEMDKIHPTGFKRFEAAVKKTDKATESFKNKLHSAWGNIKGGATVAAAGIGVVGAAAMSGAKQAGAIQQKYREINNLAVLGGEKQKEVTKAITEMQRQGRDMSIKYGKSQKEIAEGYEDLVKRGYTTKQAVGALQTELQASVASGDHFSDVTTVSSQVLDAFGMRANNTSKMLANTKRVVNELAYSADATSTGFSDLGIAMSYVGTTAKSNNISLAETAAALGVLSNNGLESDKAGTALRGTINGITGAIKKIGGKGDVLTPLGLGKKDLLDSSGNLKNLSTVMGTLYKHIEEHAKGGAARNNIFRSIFGTVSMNGAEILAKRSKEVEGLTKRTEKAGKTGTYVAKLAAKNMGTAEGSANSAKQAMNAFKMTLGNALLPAINKASNELARFLLSKDGEKFQKNVGGAVSKVANAFVKFIEWSTSHKTQIKWIGGAVLAGYSVAKAAKFIIFLHDVQKSLQGIKAIDFAKSLFGKTDAMSSVVSKVGGFVPGIIKGTAAKIGSSGVGTTVKGVAAKIGSSRIGTTVKAIGANKAVGAIGKFVGVSAGVGLAASAGMDIYSAIKAKNKKAKFTNFGKGIGTAIGAGVGGAIGGTPGALIGGAIGKFVGGVTGRISAGFSKSKFGRAIGKNFRQSMYSLKLVSKGALKSISKDIRGMASAFGINFKKMDKSMKPVSNFLKSGIVASARLGMKLVTSAIKRSVRVITGLFHSFASAVKFVGHTFKGTVAVINDLVHGRLSKAWKDFLKFGSKAINDFKGIISGLWKAVKNTFGWIGDTVSSVWNFFSKKSWEVSGSENSTNVLKANQRINNLKNGNHHPTGRTTNGSVSTIAANNRRLSHLRAHAKGGRINRNHVALVGEAGPELAYKRGSNARLLGANGPQVTKVRAGEHILNARDTAKVLSGGLGAGTTLKGYADGTDHLKKTSKSVTKDYKDIANKSTKSLKKLARTNKSTFKQVNSDANKQTKQTKNRTVSNFNSLHKNVSKLTAKTRKDSVSNFTSMYKGIGKQMDAIHDGVISSGKSTAKGFGGAMDKMHKYAHSAMADTTNQLNKGISSIDKVLGQFGGNNSVIKPIKFARGTDSQGRLTQNTLSMVNDATQGPRQEALVSPDNHLYLLKGENLQLMLPKGWGVLNGTQTQQVANKAGIRHFAKGSGVSHSELRKIAKKANSDPSRWFKNTYTSDVKSHGSDLNKGTTALGSNSSTKYGNPWSNAMWGVINKAIDSDGGSINATGLLKAAEKYGEGHRYVWGATGPNTFDCSGLVMYTLKHAYGINYPHFSGSQYNMTRHISKADARMGDLVFWGAGGSDHVGVYAGGDKYFSAESPAQGIHMNTLDSVVGKGRPLFGRIKGMPSQNKKAMHTKKPDSKLTALVKSELGSHALKWIKDNLGDEGGMANPVGDGVKRWRKYITRAASQMHTSVTGTEINKILSMISAESSGNPTITQQIQDVNSANGNPAKGLLQFVPNTFNAFAAPGHKHLLNGYDQLLALFNDSNWRSDIHYGGGWGPTGHRRFAKGGKPKVGQNVIVGEHGPEIARFTDPVQIYSNEKSKKSLDLGKLPGVQEATHNKHGKLGGTFAPVININFNGDPANFSSKQARKIAEIVQRELEKVFNSIDEEFC